YTHRAMTVMESLGIDHRQPFPTSVSAVVSTNRPTRLGEVLTTHAAQLHEDKELILVTHGFTAPDDLRARAVNLGIDHLEIVEVPADETLGTCLTRCVEAASGDVIATMEDDELDRHHY